jgi:nucleoside-diphosphate-sugar epimerase
MTLANPLVEQSVLVTGGTGFIGGHLVRRLIGRGCRVSCLVRAASRVDEIRHLGVRLIVGDIVDREAMASAIAAANPRVVFHLAGAVRALDAEEFMRANAGGVEAVAQVCAERPDPPVVVLVSSLAAAGHTGDRPAIEGDPDAPVSDYGRSKLAGERVAMKYADKLPVTVVRPCIVFGAGDRGLFQVFQPIARSGLHAVVGAGDALFSLIAVADLVECLMLAAEQGERLVPSIAGRGVYFAAAEDVAYVELGTLIARALGKPPPRILHMPEWSMRTIGRLGDVASQIRGRPGWVSRDKIREVLAGSWTCSSAKAQQQLGWSPAAPLAERLRETALWYGDANWL